MIKGQVSLEYVLMILIGAAAVLAIIAFLIPSQEVAEESATCSIDAFVCGMTRCIDSFTAGQVCPKDACGNTGVSCSAEGRCVPGNCGGGGSTPTCTPSKTCTSEGYDCGSFQDDCGSTVECGSCETSNPCKIATCSSNICNIEDDADNTICSLGACCSGDCVDTDTDENNCGSCETECEADQTCEDGSCRDASFTADECIEIRGNGICEIYPKFANQDQRQGCVCINEALENEECSTIYLKEDINPYYDVHDSPNFDEGWCVEMVSEKTLDCENHIIKRYLYPDNDLSSKWGIHLHRVENAKVLNCNIQNSGIGIYLKGSKENELKGNTISDVNYGIILTGDGQGKYGSEYNEITNNEISNAVSGGVFLTEGETYPHPPSRHNTVSNNKLIGNAGKGIAISCKDCSENEVTDNIVKNNGRAGIYIYGYDNLIDSNTVFSNGYHELGFTSYESGIDLRVVSRSNDLVNNIVTGNAKYGLNIIGKENEIKGNTFCDNGAEDIYISPTAGVNKGSGNTCDECPSSWRSARCPAVCYTVGADGLCEVNPELTGNDCECMNDAFADDSCSKVTLLSPVNFETETTTSASGTCVFVRSDSEAKELDCAGNSITGPGKLEGDTTVLSIWTDSFTLTDCSISDATWAVLFGAKVDAKISGNTITDVVYGIYSSFSNSIFQIVDNTFDSIGNDDLASPDGVAISAHHEDNLELRDNIIKSSVLPDLVVANQFVTLIMTDNYICGKSLDYVDDYLDFSLWGGERGNIREWSENTCSSTETKQVSGYSVFCKPCYS